MSATIYRPFVIIHRHHHYLYTKDMQLKLCGSIICVNGMTHLDAPNSALAAKTRHGWTPYPPATIKQDQVTAVHNDRINTHQETVSQKVISRAHRVCGMCGEEITHTGNGKVHINCRTLRESMGEGEAKRFLHEAVAKRGQKRECDHPEWVCAHIHPPKVYKVEVEPPPLPPPADGPPAYDSSTDEEAHCTQDCLQRPTALAGRQSGIADAPVDCDTQDRIAGIGTHHMYDVMERTEETAVL